MFSKESHLRITVIVISTSVILIGLANAVAIEANLGLNVEGSGFHRIFIYQIHIANLAKDNCQIGLNLNIPSTLYVSIDELADLERYENVTACSLGETDVELFAEYAKSQELTVCTRFKNGINILSLKLHQRYQRSRNNENHVDITVPNPKLILGCKERVKGYPVSKIDVCEACAKLAYKWREIPYEMKTKRHTWTIPVGELSQKNFVSRTTLAATVIGTIYIVKFLPQQS